MAIAAGIGVAVGTAGGAIGSGALQSSATKTAAKEQAQASTDAAKIQQETAARALAAAKEQQDYNRGQYANYQSRLQPYSQAGVQAVTRLSDLLGPGSVPSVS